MVQHISDRVAVMYLGKIVELASTEELYATPLTPTPRPCCPPCPSRPQARKQRIILNGEVPSPVDPPSGCRFHPRCPRKFGPCAESEPPLKEAAPGHSVACFLPQ